VVYAQKRRALRPEQAIRCGWWCRLEGNVNIKWLRRIKLGDKPCIRARNLEIHRPDATDLARFHLADRTPNPHHFPCPEKPLDGPASMKSGDWRGPATARSSASTYPRTAASTGRPARLHEPVLSKALLTKFTLPGGWDGRPRWSHPRHRRDRYVQPTIAELRKQRGSNSVYHNNSIQTWHVNQTEASSMYSSRKALPADPGILLAAGGLAGRAEPGSFGYAACDASTDRRMGYRRAWRGRSRPAASKGTVDRARRLCEQCAPVMEPLAKAKPLPQAGGGVGSLRDERPEPTSAATGRLPRPYGLY